MTIVLPVGVSFYTFQTMTYTLDAYLRRAEPTKSLLDFSLRRVARNARLLRPDLVGLCRALALRASGG